MSTTVPVAKAKLLELFTGVAESSTEVWAGKTLEDHQAAENVYIDGARGKRRFVTLPATGPRSRQEEYTIQVTVEIWRAGNDYLGAEERMWAIVNACELAIATNPPVAGLESWGLAENFQQETPSTVNEGEDGFLARYVFGVLVIARI